MKRQNNKFCRRSKQLSALAFSKRVWNAVVFSGALDYCIDVAGGSFILLLRMSWNYPFTLYYVCLYLANHAVRD